MKLSDTEKKILMLAMDSVASDGEIAAAASRFFHSLRKRYKNGIDLIKALEAWDEQQRPMPAGSNPFQQYQSPPSPFGGVSFTRPFGQAPPNPNQPKQRPHPEQQWQPPPSYGFTDWQNILRRAQQQATAFQQRQYQAHADAMNAYRAAQQANAQAAKAHEETEEHKAWAKEKIEPKKPFWKRFI